MIKFAMFLYQNFDIVLGSGIIVISGITLIFWVRMNRRQPDGKIDDECKKLLLEEMHDPKSREQYLKNIVSIWVYFPFILVDILLLMGATTPYILLAVIVLLILSEIIYLARKPMSAFALLDYTDASMMFCNVVFQNFILLIFLFAIEFLKLHQINLSSKLIPSICWAGGLHGLFSLVHTAAGGKKDALHTLSPYPLVWLTLAQSFTVISSWAVGSYLFAPALGHQNISWVQWFRYLFAYQGSPFISGLRWAGIGLMLITAVMQCHFTVRLLKAKGVRGLMPGGIPVFLLLCGMICSELYIMSKPNYLERIGYPCFDTSEIRIESSYAYTPGKIDDSLLVFPNGAPLYFDNDSGLLLDYSIRIADDFSLHPYLRIYSKTLYDGCLTIWVENQGEADVSSCKFDLTDSEGQLSEHFSKETLSVKVQSLASGEHFCLFTLRNADMVMPEYSEIPLSLSVVAVFDANLQHWKTSQTVPGEAMMSIRGVTIVPSDQVYLAGQLLIPGEVLHIGREINYGGKQKIPSFYCDRTALLQIDVSTITASGRVLPWDPIFLVYEVRD